CSKVLKNKIQSRSDFQKIKQDPILLIQVIEEHTVCYNEEKYPLCILFEALKNLVTTRQKENESLIDYTSRIKSAIDVLVSQLGGPIVMPRYMNKVHISAEEAFENLLAVIILENADKSKYSALKNGLENQYSLSNNQYPKTCVDMINALSNHKVNDKLEKTQKNITKDSSADSPELSFAQLENDTCFCCGRKGHKSPRCRYNKKPKEEWAINKIQTKKSGTDKGKTSSWALAQFPVTLSQSPECHMKNYLLLDSQSSIDLMCNSKFVVNIREAETPIILNTNAGTMEVNQTADLPGYGQVYFSSDAITNVLSLARMSEKFPVTFNSKEENALKVHTPDRIVKFVRNENNLYAKKLTCLNEPDSEDEINDETCLVETVKKNESFYTTRQIARAKEAKNFIHSLGYPSAADIRNMIKMNSVKNCPITIEDIELAEKIYGRDVGALKGKTTRTKPKPVISDTIAIPDELKDAQRSVDLCIDIMVINGLSFFTTISRNIKYRTAEFIKNHSIEEIKIKLDHILEIYQNAGFNVKRIFGDNEFKPLKHFLSNMNIILNICSAHEHVPEIERSIRVIKERVRATYHDLPFKKLSTVMWKYIVMESTRKLNYFPATDGISQYYSPREILHAIPLDYEKSCKIPMFSYVQAHDEPSPKNSNKERTISCLYLRPLSNFQGGHELLTLNTWHIITRRKVTLIPMTEEVIKAVSQHSTSRPLAGVDDDASKNENDASNVDFSRDFVDEPTIALAGVSGNDNDNDDEDNDENSRNSRDNDNDDEDNDNDDEVDENEDENFFSEDETFLSIDNDNESENDNAIHNENGNDNAIHNENENDNAIHNANDNAIPKDVDAIESKTHPNSEENDDNAIEPETRSTRYGRSIKTPSRYVAQMHQATDNAYELVYEGISEAKWIAQFMMTYSLGAGIKQFGKKGRQAAVDEMKQMHVRGCFQPIHRDQLSIKEKQRAVESLIFITEKRDGRIKARHCANGSVQRNYVSHEEASSPTVTTEAVLLTSVIDAEENRDIMTCDIPNAFIQTDIEDKDTKVVMKIRGVLVDILCDLDAKYVEFIVNEDSKKTLYVQLKKAIYGLLESAMLFYKKLSSWLVEKGYKINPYDICVANKMINGNQHTIIWHVDDLKASHVDPRVNDNFVKCLNKEFGKIVKVKVTRGKTHDYLGMTLDFKKEGQVSIDMTKYVKSMVETFPDDLSGRTVKSPWSENLFTINQESPALDKEKKNLFHTIAAQALFLCKRGRPDIAPAVAFFTTRVQKPTQEDWQKLSRMMRYLCQTCDDRLTLRSDKSKVLQWHVDAAFAVHPDLRSHTGGVLTLGQGAVTSVSRKQKLNTRSSTEAEIVAVDDMVGPMIWTRRFLEAQGYGVKDNILHQDNQSAIKMEINGKSSTGKRSRHLNIRLFYIVDQVKKKDINVVFCPTDNMVADYLTKPLHGKKFNDLRNTIMNLPQFAQLMMWHCTQL
ncbi:MAG: hypothetical protein RL368_1907, partial [Pseudomonadota bacterium]